ncbi:tRNA glutamyl-Q(34) synthetase GluQRS [Mesobaculum littorinae]|uniref:tRNA glutamyl-Q(34) synthetase GluQRS n=1 Tax=Mesobaculum littorinae TaxID=2486419 RepID=A0A438ALM5_9RHOB|nr:tRNA glutamyl-Q(34) synthetase GluQRS [Mesobaculum littorinae]RVV99550.1 tRNA glutamyl-Q(34) synthetase GluQRS [Mesobaculum littorinae]
MTSGLTTRFAPSPTGPLHLGHAFSALLAHDRATRQGGTFLLRIEDIDQSRAKPQWRDQIDTDLAWLGLDWPRPVLCQSTRLPAYTAVLKHLWKVGLIFECRCNRRDILDAASAPQEGVAPVIGPDGVVYPGTCRHRDSQQGTRPFPVDAALRLRMDRALQIAAPDGDLWFEETGTGPAGETGRVRIDAATLPDRIGDVVLARRGMGTSYHLSVVLDDAHQGVTEVTRGQDLFDATAIHVVLQRVLGLPQPRYHHHRLIRDDTGRRLAKREDARAIARYRDEGATPQDIRAMVGLA